MPILFPNNSNEGETGDTPPLLKLQGAQIEKGISGAALLNLKTGKVCGMVKETRAAGFDLGGGAIPTRVILEYFPELRELQQAFHRGDLHWVNLITQPAIDFQSYRNEVVKQYSQQYHLHLYTPTDVLLPLEAQSVGRQAQDDEDDGRKQQLEEKFERFPVLEGLRKYALGNHRKHVLLAGQPGSGKSTTLRQLAVSLAKEGHVPVLVQLKGNLPVLELIQAEFRRMKQRVTPEQIDEWLLAERLVLLLDGVNEIPNDPLPHHESLTRFREDNQTVPMIFTTRDLISGGNLGISKRLEMQPLSDKQMREFVGKYLPKHGNRLLSQLNDRLQELAKTPLLLKMLCDIFKEMRTIPQSKGRLFQQFDTLYEKFKGLPAVSKEFRQWKSEILEQLAWVMMQGDRENPTEPWLTFHRTQAEGAIEELLTNRRVIDPASKAKEWLEDLLEHHLLQVAADPRQIEFHHQLFQEYYAAKYLLRLFRTLTDQQLKRDYLNYLKWTEPIALMMNFVDSSDPQAIRVLQQARDVDLMLSKRLSEELNSSDDYAPNLIPDERKPPLRQAFILMPDERELKFRRAVDELLAKLYSDEITILQLTHDSFSKDFDKRKVSESALYHLGISGYILDCFKEIGPLTYQDLRSDAIKLLLQQATQRPVAGALEILENLGKTGEDCYFQVLIQTIQHKNDYIREKALLRFNELNIDSFLRWLINIIAEFYIGWNSGWSYGRNTKLDYRLQLHHYAAEARNALKKLAESKDDIDVRDILRQLLNNDDPVIRVAVIDALHVLGDEDVVSYLLEPIKDPEELVRASVVQLIAKVGSPKGIPGLCAALRDRSDYVREQAAEALVKLNDKTAIQVLIQALDDCSIYIHSCAVKALVRLESKGEISEDQILIIAPKILNKMVSGSDQLLLYSINLLGSLGARREIPGLLHKLYRTLTPLGLLTLWNEGLKHRYPSCKWLKWIELIFNITELIINNKILLFVLQETKFLGQNNQAFLDKIRTTRPGKAISSLFPHQSNKGKQRRKIRDINSEESNFGIPAAGALALGKIGSRKAVPFLLQALKHECNFVFLNSWYALTKIDLTYRESVLMRSRVTLRLLEMFSNEGNSDKGKEYLLRQHFLDLSTPLMLSPLQEVYSQTNSGFLADVIINTQSRCKYYNYEIWQEAIQNEKLERQKGEKGSLARPVIRGNHVTHHYDINAEVVQVIEQNHGNVIGKQSADQKSIGD